MKRKWIVRPYYSTPPGMDAMHPLHGQPVHDPPISFERFFTRWGAERAARQYNSGQTFGIITYKADTWAK